MRARPLVLVALLLASGLAALAPAAQAASSSVVARLDISDSAGTPGLVGHSAVHHRGATYIFGGRLSNNDYSDKVYKYDHATDRASVVATLPAVLPSNSGGRYSGAAMALGEKIYYFGGAVLVMVDINGDGTPDPVPQSSADVFEFDPATNAVTLLPEKLPKSAWGMAAAAFTGTRGYLFGGFTFSVDAQRGIDASRRDWVVEFDPTRTGATQKRFVELTTRLPYPVQDAAAARLGDSIWVMGGLANNHNTTNPCATYVDESGNENRYPLCQSKGIVPFDPALQVVRPDLMKEMPYRAQFITAAVVNGKAYVPGGILPDGSAASGIVELDPASRTPVRVLAPTLPRGTFGAPVVAVGDALYLFGGRIGGERQLTDDVVRIDLAPTVPWAPRNAAATAVNGGLRIAWEPPLYDGDSPVSLYRVYRAEGEDDEALLRETPTVSVDDLAVKPGVAYRYRITAVNAVGESNASARLDLTAGTTPPGAVKEFEAYAGDREALLRWAPPGELGGSNLSGYRVVRDGQVVATVPAGRTEHRDTGLTNGVAYAYAVRAYNAKGDGPASPILRISPAAVPPSPSALTALAQDNGVSLAWEPPAGAWERFIVYRSSVAGARGEPVGVNLTSATYVDQAAEKGKTYHYTVASVNAAGESPPSEPAIVSLVRAPGAPQQVVALGGEGEIRVTWRAPADAGDAPPETLRYYVSRSSAGGAARIVASDLRTTTYVDRTVQANVPYAYTVTTLNPLAGAPSEPATATAREKVNIPPMAKLALAPPVAKVGEAVTLDAGESADPDGRIRAYVFDFGDGSDPAQSPSSSVTHVYDRNGTYEVKVIVTDDRNTDAFATARLVVGEVVGEGAPGGELPGTGAPRTPTGQQGARPGTGTPGVPGPGPLAVLAMVGAAALVLGALRRRGA